MRLFFRQLFRMADRALDRLFGLAGCRLSPQGKYALAASAVMVGLGLYKGINLLVLFGYTIPVMLLFSGLMTRRLGTLRAARRVAGPVFAGTPFEIEVR